MYERIFLIVLDSLGVGAADDALKYGDEGANTLGHIIEKGNYNLNVLEKLGFLNLVGVNKERTIGYRTIMKPKNLAKDTLNGHYEMMGLIEEKPFQTYPDGFPLELISEIQHAVGREVIGNVVASGTKIIEELGEMHMKTGAIIIYTSADSVLQVAAHESIIPVQELYNICKKISEIVLTDKYKIGRVIARPFIGKPGDFVRTPKRKDFTVVPKENYLDLLFKHRVEVLTLGKIGDIFANKSITTSIKTTNNIDGLMKLIDVAKSDFKGLCFLNLNDFDTLFGHRRDRDGYLRALEELNYYLPIFLNRLKPTDLVIFTADHGNDPTYTGTDHTRENVPLVAYSTSMKSSGELEPRDTFADVGATIIDNFSIEDTLETGVSFLELLH